jgi:homoserine O-acetyltransferase
MDWQTTADAVPASIVSEARALALLGRAPATGAWREGDPVGDRRFVNVGDIPLESGGVLPNARIAYEQWGTLSPRRDNAILVLHALTGDSHVIGPAGPGHPSAGWWPGVVGPGLAIDTDRWFVVAPNVLGGCQGSTGPASLAPDGIEWGTRFPFLTIRDQVRAQLAFAAELGIERFAAVVGGSMGAMHVLEWAIMAPEAVERIAVLAAPAAATADQVALNSVQIEAVRSDPCFRGGDYYDAPDGEGPTRGLALARRMAMLNYRTATELNARFERSWQSDLDPLGGGGRQQVLEALRREQLPRAHRGHELARRRARPRRRRRGACRHRGGEPRARHRQRPLLLARRAGRGGRSGASQRARRPSGARAFRVRPRRIPHRACGRGRRPPHPARRLSGHGAHRIRPTPLQFEVTTPACRGVRPC